MVMNIISIKKLLCVIILLSLFYDVCGNNYSLPFPELAVQYISKKIGFQKDMLVQDEKVKVIGTGLGRTGTMTLKSALDHLGYKTYHMQEVFAQNQESLWRNVGLPDMQLQSGNHSAQNEYDNAVAEVIQMLKKFGYNATADFPACKIFRPLRVAYPDAKVILTVRDNADAWVNSFLNTIYPLTNILNSIPFVFLSGQPSLDIRAWLFGYWELYPPTLHLSQREKLLKYYHRWNQHVIDSVPPERLLILNVKQGWKPLCKFLNIKDCPTGSFPRGNSTKHMRSFLVFFEIY